MYTLMLCLATTTVGIDVGWQRMPEGGMEYIIQLDPQTLESLRAGKPIQSDIPPSAGEIRSYRIIVGGKKPPRETLPATPKPAELPDLAGKPFPERPAAFLEQPSAPAAAKPQPPATAAPPAVEPARPWLPLTFTLLGLFASLGANVYLGWIAWDFRQRLVLNKAVS